MKLSILPSPTSQGLLALLGALPSRLHWPKDANFEDLSGVEEANAAGVGAMLNIDGTAWSIRDNRLEFYATTKFPDDPTRSLVSAVDVAWECSLDADTGAVYAVPAFSGIEVTEGPGSLADLCAAVGFGRRKLADIPGRPEPVEVTINGATVPVVAAPGITPAQFAAAIASPKFTDWAASMSAELTVSQVTIQSVDLFGKNVGFLKFTANVT